MERFFAPGGRLAAAIPAFEPRPQQAALAAEVEAALAAGEHLLVEAGTGTGKSLGYLIPALESGRRVVVATATKALQGQLLDCDVPIAAAALGRALKVAVVKGRQNYVCRRSVYGLGLLGGALLRSDADAAAYERLAPWLDETETGDRAELDTEPSETLWAELAVGADRCLGRRCPFLGSCFAEAARARAEQADLVIANHALYFADLAVRDRNDGVGVLPDHDAVVFDEAHRLEDSAAAWLGGRVSAGGLALLARDVERVCREASLPVPARALDRVERSGRALFRETAPLSGRVRLRQPAAALGRPLADALAELATALAGRGEDLDAIARRAVEHAAGVDNCLDPDVDRVVWAEPDALAWAPVDVSAPLRELLWEGGPTAILVSATLATRGDTAFVRGRLGLRRARELLLDSPFDFAAQTLLYVPRGLPEPRDPLALERVAEETVALCRISAGRALVLTSSYRVLSALAEGIRAAVPYPVLVQGEAPRERLLERFRVDVDSVLVATATFWQGVDVPGESLSLLVIDKLPFAAPGDPLVEARCERLAAGGSDGFSHYLLPSAVLQLRQGFGRLVRAHSDRGVVAILDPRLRTRGYGRVFLDSLPGCPIVADRAAVADFLVSGTRLSA
ncbi:MAG: ATP-dependent DNA helicase [Gaiellaceae bacterium]